jgi:7-cyano-7-deazaguanine reductase
MSKFKAKHLGKQSQRAVTTLDLIPWNKGDMEVTLDCTEFTSHCPVTKQPDFAKLTITYMPDAYIVETKSMKLYLWQFRDRAEFNEKLVAQIADDFQKQLNPIRVRVEGRFNTRGGIAVTAVAERFHED